MDTTAPEIEGVTRVDTKNAILTPYFFSQLSKKRPHAYEQLSKLDLMSWHTPAAVAEGPHRFMAIFPGVMSDCSPDFDIAPDGLTAAVLIDCLPAHRSVFYYEPIKPHVDCVLSYEQWEMQHAAKMREAQLAAGVSPPTRTHRDEHAAMTKQQEIPIALTVEDAKNLVKRLQGYSNRATHELAGDLLDVLMELIMPIANATPTLMCNRCGKHPAAPELGLVCFHCY